VFNELLNFVAWTSAVTVAAPSLLLSAELAASLLHRRPRETATAAAPTFAVLVPAHNEAIMIGRTVAGLRTQLGDTGRLLVVADNCTDATAAIARDAGAEVIERFDDARRGKGYALDFGVSHLASNPPAVVIIVDADVRVRPGSLVALARQAAATRRAAQCIYVLSAPPEASAGDTISHLAFTVRNHIRPLGLMRIGGVCPLFGAGMAFPWDAIATAPLASGNIVEDLALALDLAAGGRPPMLCPAARVDGELVALDHGDDLTQRRRWEHGHLRTILTHAPAVLLKSIFLARPRAALLAIDVMIPPLSLLLMLSVGALAACGLAGVLGASLLPFTILAGVFVTMSALVTIAWWRYAECQRPLRPLLAIPGYALRKIPLYLSFFTKAEKNWNRAYRPDPSRPPTPRPVRSFKRAA
jgi:cellulose synthase/poly-beta-1,6-N-acetylglucosamine synthase-like glycosyltransferase